MAVTGLISIEEYMATSYRPDCEYIDGELLERNVGEVDHSGTQLLLGAHFAAARKRLGVWAGTEQRVQVKPTRFRIPDLCVVLGGKPREQIVTRPPFLCVEILSKEDSMTQMQDRIRDYQEFGVPNVWVIDPWKRRGYMMTALGKMEEALDGVVRTDNPEIRVPLAEIFD